nr:peroxisome biogenesis factor 2-like [Dermatophagoides farinae]
MFLFCFVYFFNFFFVFINHHHSCLLNPLQMSSLSSKNQHYVGRAIQLEIAELDNYFVNNIVFHLNSISESTYRFVPELKLLIQTLLWYRKLYGNDSSIGLDIFKCRYYSSTNQSSSNELSLIQKCSYLLKYSLQYLQDRLDQYPSNRRWTQMIEKFLLYYRTLEMLNLYVFIYNGKYRTIHERLFGIRIVSQRQQSSDSIFNHSFLNRELMWNAMIEVLTTLIPFITTTSLYRSIIKRIYYPIRLTGQQQNLQEKVQTKSNRCQICDLPAVNAQAIPNCRHIYCYFCIIHILFEDGIVKCDHCQVSIDSADKLLRTFHN